MSSTVYFPKTKLYPYQRQWDLKDIWKSTKDFQKKKIKISELWDTRYAKAWCWQHEEEVINNEFFLHHMERVLKADLSYPIILSEENLIFDGVHRLVKAKHLGLEYIEYVQFKKDPPTNTISENYHC
jgi:disulfide oxidoreductase YuzD